MFSSQVNGCRCPSAQLCTKTMQPCPQVLHENRTLHRSIIKLQHVWGRVTILWWKRFQKCVSFVQTMIKGSNHIIGYLIYEGSYVVWYLVSILVHFGPNLNLCAIDTNDRFSSCWVDHHRSVNCLWWWMSSCAEKRTGDSVSFSLQGESSGVVYWTEALHHFHCGCIRYNTYPRWSLPSETLYYTFSI